MAGGQVQRVHFGSHKAHTETFEMQCFAIVAQKCTEIERAASPSQATPVQEPQDYAKHLWRYVQVGWYHLWCLDRGVHDCISQYGSTHSRTAAACMCIHQVDSMQSC